MPMHRSPATPWLTLQATEQLRKLGEKLRSLSSPRVRPRPGRGDTTADFGGLLPTGEPVYRRLERLHAHLGGEMDAVLAALLRAADAERPPCLACGFPQRDDQVDQDYCGDECEHRGPSTRESEQLIDTPLDDAVRHLLRHSTVLALAADRLAQYAAEPGGGTGS